MMQAGTQARQFGLQARLVLVPPRMRQRPQNATQHTGSGLGRRIDLGRVSTDEQRHAASACARRGAGGSYAIELTNHIQPALGGDFLAALRHQAHMLGPGSLDDVQHVIGHGGFEIQRHLNFSLQPDNILISNVTAIFTQMEGDDVCPSFDSQVGGRNGVGAASGIAQRGNVINMTPNKGASTDVN